MSWNCTEPPSSRTDPLLVYVDQNNPSDSGLVDDSSLFTALAGPSSTDPNATIYTPRKSAGGLRRPVGIVFGGGNLFWAEQGPPGVIRTCVSGGEERRCASAPHTLLPHLNCPLDLAIDFHRSQLYLIHYGGGNGAERAQSCGGWAQFAPDEPPIRPRLDLIRPRLALDYLPIHTPIKPPITPHSTLNQPTIPPPTPPPNRVEVWPESAARRSRATSGSRATCAPSLPWTSSRVGVLTSCAIRSGSSSTQSPSSYSGRTPATRL